MQHVRSFFHAVETSSDIFVAGPSQVCVGTNTVMRPDPDSGEAAMDRNLRCNSNQPKTDWVS
jgi:hypothetical protein